DRDRADDARVDARGPTPGRVARGGALRRHVHGAARYADVVRHRRAGAEDRRCARDACARERRVGRIHGMAVIARSDDPIGSRPHAAAWQRGAGVLALAALAAIVGATMRTPGIVDGWTLLHWIAKPLATATLIALVARHATRT